MYYDECSENECTDDNWSVCCVHEIIDDGFCTVYEQDCPCVVREMEDD